MTPPPRRPAPTRRTALRGLLGTAAAGAAAPAVAGCATPWGRLRVQPLEGDPPPPPLPPDADELARRDLLDGVRALRAAVAAPPPADAAVGADLAGALAAVLAEQEAALAPDGALAPADLPPAGADPAGAPAALATAMTAAADRAVEHLERVTGPVARLAAAVAAGHRVAAAAVAVAAGAPEPAAPPEPGPLTGPGEPEPLAAAVRAEGAARYGCAVVAVHLGEPLLALALADLEVHRRAADLLAAAAPPGAAPPAAAYALPFAVVDAASAVELAVVLEDGTADAWADLVGAVAPGDRAAAAGVLAARARRAAAWRRVAGRPAQLRALPGVSGRA